MFHQFKPFQGAPSSHVGRFAKVQSFLLISLFTVFAHGQQLDTAAIESAEIMNLHAPVENVYASGQPTEEQFQLLAKSGVKHIINLRPSSEQQWDEGAYVKSLGMEYHSIPIAGAADLTDENAKTLDQLLSNLEGQPLLVHCASSNRVGGLRAVTENHQNGKSIDEALTEAHKWGLTGMEPAVRGVLSGK